MDDLEKRVARLERMVERQSKDLEAAEQLIGQFASGLGRMWRQIDALTREAGLIPR